MSYIRTCWNQHCSPEEFLAGLSESEELEASIKLLEICGKDNEPALLFLEYFSALMTKPNICTAIFSNVKEDQEMSLFRLILEFGDKLFSNLLIGDKISAKCALNALRICVWHVDVEKARESVNSLANSNWYSVHIASARYFYPSDVDQIIARYESIIPKQAHPPLLPFPMTLLTYALCAKPKTKSILFSKHNLSTILISELVEGNKLPQAASFLEPTTFFHLCLHGIQEYLNHPTLDLAYLITNVYVRIYYKLINNDVSTINPSTFNRSAFEELMLAIRTAYFENPLSSYEDRENCDYLDLTRNFDQVLRLFTESSSNPNIITATLEAPMQASSLVDNFVAVLASEDFDSLRLIVPTATEQLEDFLGLMLKQGSFILFIGHLLEFVVNIRSREEFTGPFFLALSLIRRAWGYGIPSLRISIATFFDNFHENKYASPYIMQMLNPGCSYVMPAFRSLERTFNDMCHAYWEVKTGERQPSMIIAAVRERPFCYPSLFILALQAPEPLFVKNILNVHPQDSPIARILFFQVMIANAKSGRSFITAASEPDFDTMIGSPPPSLADIVPILLDHFRAITRPHITRREVEDISVAWASWSHVFSFAAFAQCVLGRLIWQTGHAYVPEDVTTLFQDVGYVLGILCARNEGFAETAMWEAVKAVDCDGVTTAAARGLAQLAVIVVCAGGANGGSDDWESLFSSLVGRCVEMLTAEERTDVRDFFALSVIKAGMSMVRMQKKIPDSVLDALKAAGDAKTMIDYFIIKST